MSYGDFDSPWNNEVEVVVSFTCHKCEHENTDSEQVIGDREGQQIVICDKCEAENTITVEPPEL